MPCHRKNQTNPLPRVDTPGLEDRARPPREWCAVQRGTSSARRRRARRNNCKPRPAGLPASTGVRQAVSACRSACFSRLVAALFRLTLQPVRCEMVCWCFSTARRSSQGITRLMRASARLGSGFWFTVLPSSEVRSRCRVVGALTPCVESSPHETGSPLRPPTVAAAGRSAPTRLLLLDQGR